MTLSSEKVTRRKKAREELFSIASRTTCSYVRSPVSKPRSTNYFRNLRNQSTNDVQFIFKCSRKLALHSVYLTVGNKTIQFIVSFRYLFFSIKQKANNVEIVFVHTQI